MGISYVGKHLHTLIHHFQHQVKIGNNSIERKLFHFSDWILNCDDRYYVVAKCFD